MTAQDLVDGLVELDAAADDYTTAMAYYEGRVGERFASASSARKAGGTADRYKVNVARTAVDAVTDRLIVASATAVHENGDPYPEADVELQATWAANAMDAQVPRLIRETSIYGDGHTFVWRDAGDRPKISYNSPLSIRVIYDPEDDLTPLYAVKRWRGRDGSDNANLLTPAGLVVRYILDGDRDAKWTNPDSWVETGRVEHDLGLPVVHFATWLPYGRPEHRDAYGGQDAINKLSTTMVHAAEQAGAPARYTLADSGASIAGDRADSLDFDDEPVQDMTREGQPSKLKVGPGEIAMLEGVKEAGQWNASESTTFIDAANWFIRVMAQSTTTPTHILDPSGSVPSGESRRIADAPLEVKVALRRGIYGARLRATLELGLRVAGYGDAHVRVAWRPSPVADDTVTWGVATAKIGAGVPQDVALAETGLYDSLQVRSWLDDTQPDLDIAHRAAVLADIASAIQGIGQGVSLGVIGQAEAQAVIATVVGRLAPEVAA
jgi:hypothetical protein